VTQQLEGPRDAGGSSALLEQPNFVLERYLDSLTNYAASEYSVEPGQRIPDVDAVTATETDPEVKFDLQDESQQGQPPTATDPSDHSS